MKKVKTNKINPVFNLDAIDRDFSIFCITTTDKYIKEKSLFFNIKDQADNTIIYSVAYDTGQNFYIMTKAGKISKRELIGSLREYEDGDKLSLKHINAAQVAADIPHTLVQLFINSIFYQDNKESSYNNISGKMIYLRPEWIEKGVGTCLEVKVHKNMCLGIHAHCITSLSHEKEMDFKNQKKQKEDYPQYKTMDNTLQCVSKAEWNKKTNYIFKPIYNSKGNIPYWNFNDYKKFCNSKLGLLYQLLRLLEKYAEYLTLNFQEYNSNEYRPSNITVTQRLKHYKDLFKNKFSNGINIIDDVDTGKSYEFVEELCNILKSKLGINSIVGRDLVANMANIHYIHDKSWYEDRKKGDVYQKYHQESTQYIIQHITFEDFKIKHKKLKNDKEPPPPAKVISLLKELAIKEDLIKRKITITDWPAREYVMEGDMTFGIIQKTKNKDTTYTIYTYMTIHPDGSFQIHQDDSYIDFDGINPPGSITYVIKNAAGDMNYIIEPVAAAEIILPYDFMKIGQILEKAAEEAEISGKILYKCIKEVCSQQKNQEIIQKFNDVLPSIKQELGYSKKYILESFSKLKQATKPLYDRIYEETGILMKPYIRNSSVRENEFFGALDINYFNVGDCKAMYCVGEIGKGMNTGMACAPNVRRIHTADGSKLFFKDILHLMNVDFVRYGRLTVIPFPFKYIREWIAINTPNIQSIDQQHYAQLSLDF